MLVGQTNSLAVDIYAAAPTIDVQGSNSRSLLRTPMISYTHKFSHGFSAAASLESPQALFYSSSVAEYVASSSQSLPDILTYVQNKGELGYIKLLAIYRNLAYRNEYSSKRSSRSGYGAQLGGSLNLGSHLTLTAQGVYGVGIARYINDLARILTDLIPSSANDGTMDVLPMWGGNVGIKLPIGESLCFASNLSRVVLDRKEGYDHDLLYHSGDYLSTTLFYTPYRNVTLGIEYLRGSHTTMDGSHAEANRAQMMVKYSF